MSKLHGLELIQYLYYMTRVFSYDSKGIAETVVTLLSDKVKNTTVDHIKGNSLRSTSHTLL